MVAVYADDTLLACWLRLGLLCRDRGAAETEDRIHLSRHDLARVTTRPRPYRALEVIQKLATLMSWSVHHEGNVWVIHFRNFAKKQGFTPRKLRSIPRNPRNNSAKTPRSPSPSSSLLLQSTKKERLKGEVADGANVKPLHHGAGKNGATVPPATTTIDPEIIGLCTATTHFQPLGEERFGKFWQTCERAYFGEGSAVVLETELAKADSYLAANPGRRPTERGLARFVRNWLDRAVEIERKKTMPTKGVQRWR